MVWALLQSYLRPYRRLAALVLVLQTINTIASLYLPTVNASIVDDGISKGDTRTIIELGVVMLTVTALHVVCSFASVYCGARIGLGFGRDVRSAIFHHVTTFSEHELELLRGAVNAYAHHQ